MDAFDLDDIDGAFYWECCRADFRAAVERARAEYRASPNDAPIYALADEFRLPAPTVWRRVTEEVPVPMRHPPIGIDTDLGCLYVAVVSGDWGGQRVVRAITDLLSDASEDILTLVRGSDSDQYRVDIEIERRDFTPPDHGGYAHRGSIFVQIALPLPGWGVIAAAYDAAVARHGWQVFLPLHSAVREEKNVALRTWGIGFLIGLGADFYGSRRDVLDALGEPHATVTKTADAKNRTALLERVPEAEPFLGLRARRRKST